VHDPWRRDPEAQGRAIGWVCSADDLDHERQHGRVAGGEVVSTTACAGCGKPLDDVGRLERVNPKGEPFVGLCESCRSKTTVLRETERPMDLLEPE
jgi:hypothetical protein